MRPASLADVPALAALHAQAFDEPWGEEEIGALLEGPGGFALLEDTAGFILCRSVAGEAEILTLAVSPGARRMGLGRALVETAASTAAEGEAESFFLEVAADNTPAIALYSVCGFEAVGRRAGYYSRADGAADAIVMRRALNRGG